MSNKARRPGTTRPATHSEDALIEHLDLKHFLEALLKRKGTRSLVETYMAMNTKGQWRAARRQLVPLADVILAYKALHARTDQAQIRAAELLLLYAGEKPAEKVQHSGAMSLAELAIEGYERAKRNGRTSGVHTSARTGSDNGDQAR